MSTSTPSEQNCNTNSETPTPEQLGTLRHMLGINNGRLRYVTPTRDSYFTFESDKCLTELEQMGLVYKFRGPDLTSPYTVYKTTELGRELAVDSFKSIRWSRSKRRYANFLDAREGNPDLTFRQFLTDPMYAYMRKNV